jgi:hypothetical protein
MQCGKCVVVAFVACGSSVWKSNSLGGMCDSIKLIGIITDMERVANVLQEFALDILYIALCGHC